MRPTHFLFNFVRRILFPAAVVAAAAVTTNSLALADLAESPPPNARYRFPPISQSTPNNHDQVIFPYALGIQEPDPDSVLAIQSMANLRSNTGTIGTVSMYHLSDGETYKMKSQVVVVIALNGDYKHDVNFDKKILHACNAIPSIQILVTQT